MSWVAELAPQPGARIPLTWEGFLKELVPPIALYYASAILVLTRGTLKIRLALLPITLFLAFRAATHLDVAANFVDPRLAFLNHGLVLAMIILAMRVVIWSHQQEPYVRDTTPRLQSSPNGKISYKGHHPPVARDAFELCFNLRGCGWNWSDGLHIPRETRPLSPRAFASSTFSALVVGVITFDCLHFSVQWFNPSFALPTGGSIYDMSLPPIPRFLRSSIICTLAGLTIYNSIQVTYHFGTLIGVMVLQQDPSQWPPLFEHPWLANSLTDLWARFWHQLFRQCFVSLGYVPMYSIAGRTGGVMGAFLISGLFHYLALWGMGKGTEFWTVGIFFVMMGVGVILEGAWKKLTGHRVGGALGKACAAVWLLGWGHLLIDAYCRKGVVASVFLPDRYRPSLILLRLVRTPYLSRASLLLTWL